MKVKILSGFAVLLSVFTLVAQPVPTYVPTNGLKGYWPFTGNANDVGGNSYNGVVTGGAVLTADRWNTANSAYLFNGTNSYILTNYTGIMGSAPRAISLWATVDTSQNKAMDAVGWGYESPGTRFGTSFNRINGSFFPSSSGANCLTGFIPPAQIIPSVWHHYVFQLNGTTMGQVQIYQDAVLLTNPTVSQNVALNMTLNTLVGANVTFGRIWIPNLPAYYKGRMDDIGIWDRVLTQCEISKLYYADTNIGTMAFNPSGYTGSVLNLAQYTQTLSGNNQFSITIAASAFSGTGVSSGSGQYNFNSPATLAPGTYTITHTFTLQGGCVQVTTNTISLKGDVGLRHFDNGEKHILDLFPNPASSQFSLVGAIENEKIELRIMDLSSKLILNVTNYQQNTIDISHLDKGLYLVEIRRGAQEIIYKKLIISR